MKFKKLFAGIICLCICFTTLLPMAVAEVIADDIQAPKASIEVSATEVKVGDEITVKVFFTGDTVALGTAPILDSKFEFVSGKWNITGAIADVKDNGDAVFAYMSQTPVHIDDVVITYTLRAIVAGSANVGVLIKYSNAEGDVVPLAEMTKPITVCDNIVTPDPEPAPTTPVSRVEVSSDKVALGDEVTIKVYLTGDAISLGINPVFDDKFEYVKGEWNVPGNPFCAVDEEGLAVLMFMKEEATHFEGVVFTYTFRAIAAGDSNIGARIQYGHPITGATMDLYDTTIPVNVHKHEFTVRGSDDTHHWYECECGAVDETTKESHSGGAATCTELAKCEKCDHAYGKLLPHNYRNVRYNDTQHWHECDCGAIENASLANHYGGSATFSEKAKCDYCNQPYGNFASGDLNGDESLNSLDAIYLLYHTFFADKYPVYEGTDYNGDGEYNSRDAIYLLFNIFFTSKYPLN